MQVSISLESGTPGFYVLLDYVDPFPKKIALLARMINTYPPVTIVSINNVRSDYFIINFTIITRIKTTLQNDLNPSKIDEECRSQLFLQLAARYSWRLLKISIFSRKEISFFFSLTSTVHLPGTHAHMRTDLIDFLVERYREKLRLSRGGVTCDEVPLESAGLGTEAWSLQYRLNSTLCFVGEGPLESCSHGSSPSAYSVMRLSDSR